MEKNEIISNLENIFCEFLRIPKEEIGDEISLEEESKWDSVTHIKMISEIEKKFKITFDIEELVSIDNLGEIKKRVLKKLGFNSEEN